MLMTDKHIIDKDNGEVRKVEDARSSNPVGPLDAYNPHLPLDAYVQLALSSPDNTPVIETHTVVRAKFGDWWLDYENGVLTVGDKTSTSVFEGPVEKFADLAKVVE